jgi:basic membrane protein A and related proteins
MLARWLMVMVIAMLASVFGAAGGTPEALKVGFIYVGPVGDYGWSYAHDQGRKYLEATLPGVKTTYVESVPEGADAERVLTQLARSGHKVIFATSYGYMDTVLKVAERFPDVIFLHCSGHKRRANMGTYFGRMYQASYLSGLIAGTMTQKKRIGYVAPIPIPEVIRITNAFVLGVRAVDPEVNVHTVWTNAWYDPATESEAANSLLDIGVDVIATQSDSPAPVQTAERRGAYGVGFNTDASKFAPTKHLTSAIWNWGPYYVEAVEQVRARTWKSTAEWWPIGTGIVGLSPLGPAVPDTLKTLVEQRTQDLIAGRFDVFWGPIKDQSGKLRIAAGEKPADEVLLGMNWFVEGVTGTLPR